jgi:CHAT domain-containing protein/Tfp pilus assembly protein PilF
MQWKVAVALVFLTLCFGVVTVWGYTNELQEAGRLEQQRDQLQAEGKYTDAVRFGEQVLAIREKTLGPDHPGTAAALSHLALLYQGMGDYVKALPLSQRALEICERALGPDHPDTATALNNLAALYRKMGQYAQALPLHQRSLAIREKALGPDHPQTAVSLNSLATLYQSMGRYDEALPLFQRALTIQEKTLGPDHPDTARSLNNLATFYQETGDNAKALPLQERVFAIIEKKLGPDHPQTATARNNLAALYIQMGEHAQAAALREREQKGQAKALDSNHKKEADRLIPQSHLQQALLFKKQMIQRYEEGQYSEAASIGEQLLARLKEDIGLENSLGAEVLNFQGEIHTHMGKYSEAVTLLRRAVAIREKVLGPEHPDTAISLNNLGWAYQQTGYLEKALPLHLRAVAIFEKAKGSGHPHLAYLLRDLGSIYGRMGDNERALSFNQRALAIQEKTLEPDNLDIAGTLVNLAAVYLGIEDEESRKLALPLLHRALVIRERKLGADHPDTANILSLLGRFHLQNGDIEKGYEFLQRALAIQEKVLGPSHPNTLVTRDDLLTLPLPEVLPHLQQLLVDKETTFGPDHYETIYTRTKVANGFELQKDYRKALQLFERNLQSEDQILANVFALLTEDQKHKLIEALLTNYHGALWTIRTAFSNDEAVVRAGLEFVLRRKGIVLDVQSRVQEALVENLQGEALKSWQRLTQYRSDLSHILLGAVGTPDAPGWKESAGLKNAIAREAEVLVQYYPMAAREQIQQPVTAQEVARHLPQDGALVEFVRIWDYSKWLFGREMMDNDLLSYYIAFVLTPDNHVALIDLGRIYPRIPQTRMVFGEGLSLSDLKTETANVDDALADLYNKLLRPLEAVLGSRKRLIISPDGELNRVPFAALRTPDGHYLIEKMAVSYVTSGRDLLWDAGGERSTIDLLLIADPAFDDREALRQKPGAKDAIRARDYRAHFDSLPATAEEAKIIPKLLKGTQQILQGKEATELAVRSQKSPRVLHIATHGFFLKDEEISSPDDPLTSAGLFTETLGKSTGDVTKIASHNGKPVQVVDPMVRSGLALAGANYAKEMTNGDDGLLTALEVSGMNLYGTDLVVLSACETGAGNVQVGEGVYGLRRAFVLAGAKNLVMSLWAVNDKITLGQMAEFYRGYTQGKSPAEALREAQLKSIASLREQTRTAFGEPFAPVRLWAPFIVQQTAEHEGNQLLPVSIGYGWWNLLIPFFAMVSLLVLARVHFNFARLGTAYESPLEPMAPQQAVRSARLLLRSALDGIPREVACVQDEILLGSGSECDVILLHPSIALQHARMQWHGQGYVLYDLRSPSGTYVNGRRITENLLKEGWVVQLGDIEFIFHKAI